MKKLLTIILLTVSCHAFAQQDSLKIYNAKRVSITSHGMEVLGAWGILNLASGAYLNWGTGSKTITITVGGNQVPESISSISPELKYFGQMNTVWGGVNFLTAVIGYTGQQNSKNKKLTAAQIQAQQDKLQKIFLINGCLDVAYIGAGAYLKLAGDSRNSPMMKGYGESVLLQGAFLLVFDGLMYHSEKNNNTKLRNFLQKHPITFDGKRVGIIFNM